MEPEQNGRQIEQPGNDSVSIPGEVRRLIEADVSLIPLEAPDPKQGIDGKAPDSELLPGGSWTNLRQKPADRNLVLSWFNRSEDFNLGIICGEKSGLGTDAGLVVVDWDLKNWNGDIPPDLGLPDTSRVQTGSGFHDYYLYSEPDEITGSTKCPPLDLQAEGTYVVAPPSTHENGDTYRWLGDHDPLQNVAELKPRELENVQDFIRKHQKGSNNTTKTASKPSKGGSTSDEWKELASREKVAVEILKACGADVSRLGESFLCPLPGHNEANPSAALYRPDSDEVEGKPTIQLHDFHHENGREYWRLPDVYASCESGTPQDFSDSPGMRRIWWLRALNETGHLDKPNRMAPELPDDVTDSIRKVYNRFVYLLELRSLHDQTQKATPYTWNFIRTWTGIGSNSTVNKALKYLYKHDYLEVVEERSNPKADLIALGNPEE